MTDGGALNRARKSRRNDYGVTGLFRPLHEMNQRAFWWGGRSGPAGTAKLYRLTRDYLTRTKDLTNLIGVWVMQDMSRNFADYHPGSGYWDVVAFDIYSNGCNQSLSDYILPIVGHKPMAFGECERLPTARMPAAQPRRCFFRSWAELTFTRYSNQQILDLFRTPNVVTRALLPKFK